MLGHQPQTHETHSLEETKMPGILILGETENGSLGSVTGELIAVGRSLADSLGDPVSVALQDEALADLASGAIELGADCVYTVADALLANAQPDAQLSAFEQVCQQTEPSVVLIGRTPLGRDLGPRLAFRLGVAVAQDCTEIGVDSSTNRVIATRPVYGGSAVARVTFPGDGVQVVIARPKTFEALEPDSGRTGDIEELSVQIDPDVIQTKLVETVTQEAAGIRLEDADVVVSGGRGMGGPEPFEQLSSLADVLTGAMGASRAACDAGWLDHSYQVGLTGKTITPNLYVTVAISGASQHMAGCSGAKFIVAINRDKDANIFKSASYGVVGDWNNVLPAFIESVRELVES
ncbi:MAG: electron transfer flavoprotein subunit alpha/FixB family protein [SAR202 cluster bacterium]|nr:electron transfer flavoprotein subunit alpha/FixB family protein [SAR202 cluster bacterium]